MGRPKHRKIYILLVILFFMAGVLLGIRYFQSKESVEIRKKDAASHIKKEHPMKIPKETEKAQRESEKVQEQESMETEEKAEVNITETQAGDVVEDSVLAQKGMEQFFYKEELSDEVFARMDGVSYPQNARIGRDELRYLRVLHTGFDGKTHIGELVVNQKIADDEASMSDNNTSAFNYRTIAGTDRLSKHGQGLAVDINPRYNPCVRTKNGITTVEPQNGSTYVDRNADFSYKITEGDLCLQLFSEHGFTWGGSWNSVKDYQHFEKAVE